MKKLYFSILFLFVCYTVSSQTTAVENETTSKKEIVGFKAYPNPVTSGILYISSLDNATKQVQIFDVLGKLVINKKINTLFINLDNLKSGLYILRVTENNKTATRKLVIK